MNRPQKKARFEKKEGATHKTSFFAKKRQASFSHTPKTLKKDIKPNLASNSDFITIMDEMSEQEKLQLQEQALELGANYTPLLAIKSGTRKSKKIHNATLKLGMQNVSDICEKAGFLLNPPQAQQLTDYLYLLQKWNQSMNLVGKNSWKDVLSELVLDSLHLARFLEENPRIQERNLPHFTERSSQKYVFKTENIFSNFSLNDESDLNTNFHSFETWDLGAGAGLPGIPLRMFWHVGNYHMIEVREKRCFFLNTAKTTLGLKNTHIFHGKAEDFMSTKIQENTYADLILSRAFMPFAKMLPFVAPYLRKKEDPSKTQASIIFLTLEELNAEKYTSAEYAWKTKSIYPYTIKNKQKFLCEVCFE